MNIKSSQTLVEEAKKNIETISSDEVKLLAKKKEITLIDIRDIRELWKEGTLKNSKHIPRGMLEFWLDPQSSYYKENKFDLNKKLILFCALGSRSALSTKSLADMGFKNVAHVKGGFDALKQSGFEIVVKENANFGIVVDPDVDRLALVCEDGSMFGEEYTLVAVSDFVLSKTPGNTVSNLSSTRALRDVTNKHQCNYESSAVGEVNVVEKMKETNAIIGGEGNGGIIYPSLHYGRDALVGIALFLTQLAEKKISIKELRDSYPNYFISKNKIELTPEINVDNILSTLEEKYKNEQITTIDGLKIDFEDGWIHLRKSNTEPIIRIYAESEGEEKANSFAQKMINEIKELI